MLSSASTATGLYQFLHNNANSSRVGINTGPNASITWILFDEQFKVVMTNSGFDGVNATENIVKSHTIGVDISKNGYLYVYCSNESNIPVYFDNMQVVHNHGCLVEETHYYPFGLTMAGISSKAAGGLENKIKFQKQELQSGEFSDGSGLEMYEFKYRMDDPQTGRFWSIDPLADQYVYNSTYAFSEDKVTTHVELEGLEAEYIFSKAKNEIANAIQGAANWIDKTVSVYNKTTVTQEVSNTPLSTSSVGTSVTTTTNTNLGGMMSYVIANNTNAGSNEPATKTTTTITAETKTEIPTPMGSLADKKTIDNTGTVTKDAGIKVNAKLEGIPLTVEGSFGTSENGSNGQIRGSIQVSTGTGTTKGVANTQYTNNGSQQGVSVGVGGQQRVGNTTVTNIFGLKISW